MQIYDVDMAMCMPAAMESMPMTMAMVRGNAFGVGISETGPRGKSAFASPNMVMGDLGRSFGQHYFNLDLMGTAERWTFPNNGYPELLQIGEENSQGQPYLDAQHPHSSPIMGLTLSDTVTLSDDNYLKISIAPRGEATEGPIAFMHRPTGMINPDAPLGHHIGQDVAHIVSTLAGASLKFGDTRIESSTYHGAEPQPENVDLPIGPLDSYDFRLIQNLSPKIFAMASYAYVTNPEPDAPSIAFENRYSASLFSETPFCEKWVLNNALIYGAVTNYDQAATLTSFAEEFLFQKDLDQLWGRVEVLQRTPAELQIQTTSDPNVGQWVQAYTLGYTRTVGQWDSANLGLGISVTSDILPTDYQASYGGNSWTGKVFVQISGSHMWNL